MSLLPSSPYLPVSVSMFSSAGVSSGSNPYRSYTRRTTSITYCRRRISSGRKSRMPRAGPVSWGIEVSVCSLQFAVYSLRSSSRRSGRSPTVNCEPYTVNSLFDRRVLDPELFEIGLVPRRVVVVLLHFGAVLVHGALVQPDRRLILGTQQRLIFRVFRLDVPEIGPRLFHQLGAPAPVPDRHRLHLGAGGDPLMRDRRRHRDRVRPVVARPGGDVRREAERDPRDGPRDVA